MNKTVNDLISYIDSSPSCYHAVHNLKKRLENAGFTELASGCEWNLSPGGAYFVTRNLSSLIAFRIPKDDVGGFMITAAHSDSPAFKLKRDFEIESGGYIKVNTERYGGAINSSWLDRPLSVAGTLTLDCGDRIKRCLVSLDRDTLLIPSVAIHMNRSVNDGFAHNPAVDLVPLYSSADGKGKLGEQIAKCAGVSFSDILDFDLFVYNRQRGTVWGEDGEFFSSPRIDDLQCAYSAIEALVSAEIGSSVAVAAIFDNEEVGSASKQGADSDFLEITLERIAECVGKDAGYLLPSSMMLSADNAHAVHPNHPEYADGKMRPVMNGGVVIKYNANQKYTTDSVSGALFAKICARAGIPVQYFANRSDMAGGSTLGNIASTHVSINTVDIGCAQLAMHSSCETAGSRDTDYMIGAMREFYKSSVRFVSDGEYILE